MADEQNGTSEDPERAGLLALIEEYDGNLSAMSRALGMPNRQGLSRKLERLGLVEEADRARARAGVKGPRSQLEAGSVDPAGERAAVIAALVEHGGYRPAAVALGLSPRTMIRKMQRLGVKPEEVARARATKAAP